MINNNTKKTKEIFRYNTNRVITFGTFYDRSESKKNIAIDVNVDKKEFYIDKVKNKYVSQCKNKITYQRFL